MSAPARRRVYFISGFDPRGVAFYHRLYREEARKQAKVNGASFEVGARRRIGAIHHGWTVNARWPEGAVEVDYRFLAWDDVIRDRWTKNWAHCISQYLVRIPFFVFSRAILKIGQWSNRTQLFAALIPLLIVAIPALCAALVWTWLGWIAGLASFGIAAWLIYDLSQRFRLVWLLNIYVFCYTWGMGAPPDLVKRIDELADIIAATETNEPSSDTLLAGHSVGALVAVAVTARLLQRGIKIKLLTVGGCMPFVGIMPRAVSFRSELATLASNQELDWLDVCSLADLMCFPRVDAVEICGVKRLFPLTQRRIRARFVKMFSPESYARIRADKRRLHFQYLMAGELDNEYDFFRLTAGPK